MDKNKIRNHLLICNNSKPFSNHYKLDCNLNFFKFLLLTLFAGLFFTASSRACFLRLSLYLAT